MTTILSLTATLAWLALGGGQAQAPDAELSQKILAHWQPGSGLFQLNIAIDASEMSDQPALPAAESGTLEEQIAKVTADLEHAEKRGLLLYKRAILYIRARQNREAALDLVDAQAALAGEVAADPGNTSSRSCYAQICLVMDKKDDARKVLQEGLDRDPTQTGLLVALVPLLPAYDEALVDRTDAALRDRLSRDPGDSGGCAGLFVAALVRMADEKVRNDLVALGAGDHYDELAAQLNVLDALRAHQAKHADDPVARWWVGKAYALMGMMGVSSLIDLARVGKPALAEFLRPAAEALADVPGNPRADVSSYGALLVIRAAQADIPSMVSLAQAAAQAFPDDETVQLLRIGVLSDVAGETDKALELATPAAAKHGTPSWQATLAWLHYRAGDRDRAAEIAQQLVKEKDKVEPAPLRRALLVLAGVAASRGDLTPAGRLVDDAASVMPGPDVGIDKAILLALSGQYKEAHNLLVEVAMQNTMNLPSRELLKLVPE